MIARISEKILKMICKVAFYVGCNTAMAISRFGVYEDELEERAYEVLSSKIIDDGYAKSKW